MFVLLFTTYLLLNLAAMTAPNTSQVDSPENSSRSTITSKMSSNSGYLSVNFEVYGRVQGVFFRKFTQKQADKLGLAGWCMNTESGTVQGNMQGASTKISEMKSWLRSVGSPQSRIDKAIFSQETVMKEKPTPGFSIRR